MSASMWDSLRNIEDMIAFESVMALFVKLKIIDEFFWWEGGTPGEIYVQIMIGGEGIEWTNG